MLICGEIDLSVGQVFVPSPFIMGYAHAAGLPVVAAIVVALAACALIGLAIRADHNGGSACRRSSWRSLCCS